MLVYSLLRDEWRASPLAGEPFELIGTVPVAFQLARGADPVQIAPLD